MAEFLPINQSDMNRRGWTQCDFVYVIGDAYVDHPSFGHAIISRVLESHGYKVGIISQPDWNSKDDFMRLGKPRFHLHFGRAPTRLFALWRQHGLDGKPLFRLPPSPED